MIKRSRFLASVMICIVALLVGCGESPVPSASVAQAVYTAKWRYVPRGASLPSDAFIGGEEPSGWGTRYLYVCRAFYDGSVYTGKAFGGQCRIPVGAEIKLDEYDVLVSDPAFSWVKSTGTIPINAVGFEGGAGKVYVCRAEHNKHSWYWDRHPGVTADAYPTECWYGWGGRDLVDTDFEILVYGSSGGGGGGGGGTSGYSALHVSNVNNTDSITLWQTTPILQMQATLGPLGSAQFNLVDGAANVVNGISHAWVSQYNRTHGTSLSPYDATVADLYNVIKSSVSVAGSRSGPVGYTTMGY